MKDQEVKPEEVEMKAEVKPEEVEMKAEVKPEEVEMKAEVKPVAKKKVKPSSDQKVLDYLSGLSSRALEMQIKSQEKDGDKADKGYLAACKAEMDKRKKK